MGVTKVSSCQGYLPFTWQNQTFQLENQVDHNIPFGKLQKMWVGGRGIIIMFVLFSVCFPLVGVACEQTLKGRKRKESLQTHLWNLNFSSNCPVAPRQLSCQISANSRQSRNECKCKQTLKNTCKG